jgi:purine-nucleoside phosphorylase
MSTVKQTKREKDKEELISICVFCGVEKSIAKVIADTFLAFAKKIDEEQLLFDFGDDLDSN